LRIEPKLQGFSFIAGKLGDGILNFNQTAHGRKLRLSAPTRKPRVWIHLKFSFGFGPFSRLREGVFSVIFLQPVVEVL